MFSGLLVKYVLLASVRDRLIISLLLAIIVGTSLSVFMGGAATSEQDQFALVFTGGGLRFAGVMGLVLFIVFHIRRSFDSRDVDFLLSRPLTRTSFLLSHAIAFSIIAVIVGIFITAAVCIVAPHLMGWGAFMWGLSLIVELIIMANVALFFSMVLSSAVGGAMAVLGFYIFARLIGELIGIATSGLGSSLPIFSEVFKVISLVIPRLDLMAQSSWLVYGVPDEISGLFLLGQGAIFTGLVLTASLVDLNRRQF